MKFIEMALQVSEKDNPKSIKIFKILMIPWPDIEVI